VVAKRKAKPKAKPKASSRTSPASRTSRASFWLLKQEPTDFAFDDLWEAAGRTTNWNGVRNYAARNYLRDEIKRGDLAFFYHSNANPSAVVGIVECVREGYPDETQFDAASPYYDADSTREKPRWFQIDVRATERLARPVSITELRSDPALTSMALLRISQLSVQPVTPAEWKAVLAHAGRASVSP
jgi:predicted RNA-binding protein with PUA-like domain